MAQVEKNAEVTRWFGERRAGKRAAVNVKGKLFFPDRKYEEECQVVDLSPDGAGVKASCSVPLGAAVVLYVDGLGRFEGTLAQRDRRRVGLKFKQSPDRRARVAEHIAEYIQFGKVDLTTSRQRVRLQPNVALHNFVTKSGDAVSCEVLDIALSGASFRSTARPAVGEAISFGKTIAIVVRHTETGFAARFTGESVPAPAA
jgi:hypothetical protein